MKKHLTGALSAVAIAAVTTAFVASPKNQQIVNEPITPIKKTSVVAQAPTVWKLDRAHSNVNFTVTHMIVSEVDGNFRVFDGTMEHTKADMSDAKINFTVDATSVNTNNEGRDKHLQAADFFDTQKYPQIKFVGTSFKPLGGNKYSLTGQLTVKDNTKAVTFDVTYNGQNDTGRGIKAGFKAKATIDRNDFGIKGSSTAVGKEVDITVNLALVKAQ